MKPDRTEYMQPVDGGFVFIKKQLWKATTKQNVCTANQPTMPVTGICA